MVILSTNKKNIEKIWKKNCLQEDDDGKKVFAETYRVFQKFVPIFSSLYFTNYKKNTFCKTKHVIHYSFNVD